MAGPDLNSLLTRRSLLTAAAALQAPVRPNFIVIYTDDQGIGDLSCYGAPDVPTPHLDQLAADGVRFTSLYSNSPVCSPSRAALLTGRYPVRAGIRNFLPGRASFDVPGLKSTERTLPGELRKQGYRTALIGKWHLGMTPESRPLAQGFDQFQGFYSGWIDGFSHRYYQLAKTGPDQIYHDLWENEREVYADPRYHTELFNAQAVEFIGKQTPQQPFFLYLAHSAPHYPMIAPEKYVNRLPATLDRDRRMHAAMILAIDDGIGEIRAALKRRGLDRNTVIYFQSDNGATTEARADSQGRPYRGGSNAPFRGYKGGLFEGGIRVPALMAWPGRIPPRQVLDAPVAAFDVMPTFLQWAGAPAPPDLDGRSLAATVQKRGESPHPELFWEYQGQYAVRRGKWKYMTQPTTGLGEPVAAPEWLSNLEIDPAERENWIGREAQVGRDLADSLERWRTLLRA
jgi:arylsulfatase A-like enzyme